MLWLSLLWGCSGGMGLPDTAGRFFDVDSAAKGDSATATDTDDDTNNDSDDSDDPDDSGADTGVDPGDVDGPGDVHATCSAADAGQELLAGHYVGEVSGWTAEVDPSCAPAGASGLEVVGRLEVASLEWVRLSWSVAGRDAVLLLTSGCGGSTSCEATSDAAFAGGGESVQWFNASTGPLKRYAVLDTFGTVQDGDAYTLDVERVVASSWSGQSTCDGAPLLQPGAFVVDLDGGATDDLTLAGACASAAGSPDTHARVSVRDGQTLTVRAEALDGDVSTAVVLDCDGVCASGINGSFTNTSGATLTPTVVVEAVGGPARALVFVSVE